MTMCLCEIEKERDAEDTRCSRAGKEICLATRRWSSRRGKMMDADVQYFGNQSDVGSLVMIKKEVVLGNTEAARPP